LLDAKGNWQISSSVEALEDFKAHGR